MESLEQIVVHGVIGTNSSTWSHWNK